MSSRWWGTVERWSAAAFLIGGVIFAADTVLVASGLVPGTEPPLLTLGQAFVGASWTAAFVGLLGLYPGLAHRSRWLVRAGAIFAVVGAVTMAAMAATSFGYFAGVFAGGESGLSQVVVYFLPGVLIGCVLGFVSFGVASLRTDVYPRSVGVLLLLLPLTVVFNLGTGMAGWNPLPKLLGVVAVLSVTMLAVGYLLRTGDGPAGLGGMDAPSDSAA